MVDMKEKEKENKENKETKDEANKKELHVMSLIKYIIYSILIGFAFVWVGSVNKWLAIFAANYLCDIFPTDEAKAPYANKYYKAYLNDEKNEKVIQNKAFISPASAKQFLRNNVEVQSIMSLPPLMLFGWFNKYVWNKFFKIKETNEEKCGGGDDISQTGGGLNPAPFAPPITGNCAVNKIGVSKNDDPEKIIPPDDKDGVYFPYNLFRRACLGENETNDGVTCSDTGWGYEGICMEQKDPYEGTKEFYHKKADIKKPFSALLFTWINGYVIATIFSWKWGRWYVKRVTEFGNAWFYNNQSVPYLKFTALTIFKVVAQVFGIIVSLGVNIFSEVWAMWKTGTIIGPLLYSPLIILNNLLQILSGIGTFLFFPLFQSGGFKQCWCIFKNNWKTIFFIGILSLFSFTASDKNFGVVWASSFVVMALLGIYMFNLVDLTALKSVFSKTAKMNNTMNCNSDDDVGTECKAVLDHMNKTFEPTNK
jgi:hypothetical protein